MSKLKDLTVTPTYSEDGAVMTIIVMNVNGRRITYEAAIEALEAYADYLLYLSDSGEMN